MTALRAVRPLENITKTAANFDSRRGERLRARGVLRSLTTLKRVGECGHALGGNVRLRGAVAPEGLSAGVAGLLTCGRIWACPVCASKVAYVRSNDLEAGIRTWAGAGGSFVMLTLTMQHNRGQRLKTLWDGLSTAWRLFVSDGSAKRLRKSIGVNGYHRTTEVTYGANGWHVHLHVLFFIEGRPGDLTSADAGGKLVARWQAAVELAGFRAVADAQDWKILRGDADALASIAGYVVKGEYVERVQDMGRNSRSVAMEMTRSDLKRARRASSRTPFQILGDLVEEIEATGSIDGADWALWSEWEEASAGRRQQVWSRGMRDRLGLDVELTDDEAAALEVEGEDLIEIPAAEWRRIADDPAAHAEVLGAIEGAATLAEGQAAAAAVLDRLGVAYSLLGPPVLRLLPDSGNG